MKLTVKQRIWALPVIASVVFVIGIGTTVTFTSTLLSSIDHANTQDYPAVEIAKALSGEVQGVIDGIQSAVAEGDKKALDQARERSDKVHKALDGMAKIPSQAEAARRLGQEFNSYSEAAFPAAQTMLGESKGDMQVIVPKMQGALKILNDDIAKVNAANSKQFSDTLNSSAHHARTILFINIAVALLVIAVLIVASYIVVKMVWRQLGGEPEYARDITQAIASGDFSADIKVDSGDRESLLAALRHMQEKLSQMLAKIRESGDMIATASREITSGNADLSSRTEIQASALEETASSMEELTATVAQNSENAQQANKLVVSASEVAVKGGQIVGQVITTMDSIKDSSRKIVDIISVIDGIAFQTNILALNAAVEAARAGEQGRGFAVVAAEVRNLAQRSAAAAKEIKTLIGASVDNVNIGSKLVDEAGLTMNEIVSSVARVTNIMAEIVSASKEQSEGINGVNNTIGQMDEMTQQNAALVEQASAAAESMQEQAAKLMEEVGVFKLHGMEAYSMTHNVVPLNAHTQTRTQTQTLTRKPSQPKQVSNAPKPIKSVATNDAGGGDWEEF